MYSKKFTFRKKKWTSNMVVSCFWLFCQGSLETVWSCSLVHRPQCPLPSEKKSAAMHTHYLVIYQNNWQYVLCISKQVQVQLELCQTQGSTAVQNEDEKKSCTSGKPFKEIKLPSTYLYVLRLWAWSDFITLDTNPNCSTLFIFCSRHTEKETHNLLEHDLLVCTSNIQII